MKRITNEKAFNKEDEYEIFHKYRLLDRALQLSKDEQKKSQIAATKAKLKNYIFEKNLGLSGMAADRIKNKIHSDFSYDDCFQFASLGLMKAIDGFDVYAGYKFSTYAMRVMESVVMRSIQANDKNVHIPIYVHSEYLVISKKLQQNNKDGTCKDIKDVADEIGRSHEYVSSLINMFQGGDAPEECLVEVENHYLKEFEYKFLIEDISKCLNCLTHDERNLAVKYFGLEHNNNFSYEELAKLFGVSRQSICDRMKKILDKLRDETILTNWRAYEAN